MWRVLVGFVGERTKDVNEPTAQREVFRPNAVKLCGIVRS